MKQTLIKIKAVRGNFHLSKEYIKHCQKTNYKTKNESCQLVRFIMRQKVKGKQFTW